MIKKEHILNLVREYIRERQDEKVFIPGITWLHYSGLNYDENEYSEAVDVLLGDWQILSKKGLEFEQKFSKRLGRENGIFVNSGSSANLLMVAMLKTKHYNFSKGAKIITPISCFPTTFNPIIQNGFKAVPVDVDLSLNIDLDRLEDILQEERELLPENEYSKALLFAHALGNPPNMKRVMKICKKYNLVLLEDCCDALDTTYDGQLLGSFGDMATCSFFAAHHMSTIEGGFVVTKNKELYNTVRSLRDWGRGCFCRGKEENLDKPACGNRFSNWFPNHPEIKFDHKYVFSNIGYNLRPIELQAAIGLEQLKKLDDMTEARKRNYQLLYTMFSKYEDYFHLPKPQDKADVSWFAFPLTIKDGVKFTRNEIVNFFEEKKIQTRPFFSGNILYQPGYTHMVKNVKFLDEYPVANKVVTDTFFLGTSIVITLEMIEYIKFVLDEFMRRYI